MKTKILSLALVLCVLMTCVVMPASADTGLTFVNRKPYSIDTDSAQWAYVTKGGATTLSDGLGGLSADNYGRYYQMNAGEENRIQVKANADYFADNYFVLTFNTYGDAAIKFRFSESKYDKDFTSSVLKANQWNNITLIYDKNKSTYTRNGQFFVNGVDFSSYIGNGPDVSGGVAINMYMQDTTATYRIDNLAVYTATEAPTIVMPTATAGTNYTVDGTTITYSSAITAADIQSNGTVRAYASSDTEMKTALASDATLSVGDVVVVEAPVNASTEYINRYSYYTVAEAVVEDPDLLTLVNRKPYSIDTDSAQWAYVTKGGATTLSDGLGGLSADNYGRYYQMNAGEENRIQVKANADYFADNYFVLTFNTYGDAAIKFRFSESKYDKDFTSSVLKANQWNNITLIYDKNKSTYTRNGQFFVNGVDFSSYIGTGPDVSGGVAINMYMQDTTAQYYIDDLAVYTATEDPISSVTMPTVTAGTKYTVSGNSITLNEATTVADITSSYTVRAYDSADTEMKTALDSSATLSAGDVVVVEAPVNAEADTSEYINRYNYYTVKEKATAQQIGDSSTYWLYDEDTKTLTISGTGAMPDWSSLAARPWNSVIGSATKIEIGEGVTLIGNNSFRGSYALEEVVFPATTLTTIGESAFRYTKLTEFVIPDGVTTIGADAFYWKDGVDGANQLTSITIPDSVTSIATSALSGQTAVTIKCNSGTTARTYARTNGFTYFLMDVDYEISYSKANSIATYRSFTEQSINAVAIIFNRKSGVINDIHFEAITLDGFGTPVEVILPTDFPAEASSGHNILLWDSWTNITPLCDSMVVTY